MQNILWAAFADELEKEAALGIGASIARFGEDQKGGISVGFPYGVAIDADLVRFGKNRTKALTLGLGLTGPHFGVGFGRPPKKRRKLKRRKIRSRKKKTAGRLGATIGGSVPGVVAAGAPIGASDGKRLRTWLGSLAGQFGGAAIARGLTKGRLGPMLVGGGIGGGIGAYLAHGPNKKKAKGNNQTFTYRHKTAAEKEPWYKEFAKQPPRKGSLWDNMSGQRTPPQVYSKSDDYRRNSRLDQILNGDSFTRAKPAPVGGLKWKKKSEEWGLK